MEANDDLTLELIGNNASDDTGDEVNEDLNIVEDDLVKAAVPAGDDDEHDDPEGVGDGDQDEEDADPMGEGSSPDNFYSSIANSLRDDGILNLDEEDFKNIDGPEAFAELFNKQIENMLDEQSQRIKQALDNNVEPDEIKQYENIIAYINSIKITDISAETEESEMLRKQIIVQDYLNKGFDEKRANKELNKSLQAGTDIEDAREALDALKTYYVSEYKDLLEDAQKANEARQESERKAMKDLENKMLNVEEPIKGIKLTKEERIKMYNTYAKFVDKTPNGYPVNAIQKYAMDNPLDYQYNVNLLFYLTNGFKDFAPVVNKEVRQKTKSAISNLERTLKNTNKGVGVGSSGYSRAEPTGIKGLNVVLD
jgi:hypothetical protein